MDASLLLASCSGLSLTGFAGAGASVSESLDIEMMDRSAGNGACLRFAGGLGAALLTSVDKALRRRGGEGDSARSNSSSTRVLVAALILCVEVLREVG